jgi:hypothetical protein
VVLPTAESPVPAGQATVAALEHALAGVPGVIGTGGDGAMLIDFNHAVYGQFPLMLALIAIATFILVARAFGSVLLAAKAVVFNLISLAAAFGVLTWVFQDGHGSTAIFGVPATGAITFWVPLMVFAFLFGLSMDYEVFILTCIRMDHAHSGAQIAGDHQEEMPEQRSPPVGRRRSGHLYPHRQARLTFLAEYGADASAIAWLTGAAAEAPPAAYRSTEATCQPCGAPAGSRSADPGTAPTMAARSKPSIVSRSRSRPMTRSRVSRCPRSRLVAVSSASRSSLATSWSMERCVSSA